MTWKGKSARPRLSGAAYYIKPQLWLMASDKTNINPEDNFAFIAQLWSTYTGRIYTAHDVAIMMALFKIARIKSGTGAEDSYTDACGYVALAADIRLGKRCRAMQYRK